MNRLPSQSLQSSAKLVVPGGVREARNRFWVFLRFAWPYSAFPDRAFLSSTGGSFARIRPSTRFQTAGSHSISV